ncbi:MAG: alpha/beta hydrolase [Proteobacteria bacterium]|nr:alpha/beta hydrolase [Pseudomonadota bacterium]
MTANLQDDPRIDPRIKATLGLMPAESSQDVANREELLARANSEQGRAGMEAMKGFMDMCDNEDIAPSAGLTIETHEFTSQPDGNTIKVQFIRPESNEPLPCVYYIHGGGMQAFSCFDGMYRSWGRIIANQGVAVAMVDFRNCLTASSAPEVAPFPAGLNDCVSGIAWLRENAAQLGVDANKIIVAGESGGGHLHLPIGPETQPEPLPLLPSGPPAPLSHTPRPLPPRPAPLVPGNPTRAPGSPPAGSATMPVLGNRPGNRASTLGPRWRPSIPLPTLNRRHRNRSPS